MNTSDSGTVRSMYDTNADSYTKMMDAEIDLPLYADVLERLCKRIRDVPGTVIDSSCGSGHMLSRYHEQYDPKRPLVGIDLSPRMVEIASERLGAGATIMAGDMRDLAVIEDDSAAALLSFFAIHHLDPEGVRTALGEWHRVLQPGGQLLIAAWEGVGAIDYGDEADLVALRYRSDEIAGWTEEAGFGVDRCVVEPVDEMLMDAIYLEGSKE